MNSGHQTLHNGVLVIDDLGQWGKAVGGAGSIAAGCDVSSEHDCSIMGPRGGQMQGSKLTVGPLKLRTMLHLKAYTHFLDEDPYVRTPLHGTINRLFFKAKLREGKNRDFLTARGQ